MDQRHARGIPEYAEQHGVRSFKFFIGNAARIFGLWPRKGSVAPGADADLTLIDLKKRRVVRAEDLIISADFTPYEGMELRGWPVLTLLRGRVIMGEGQPVGEPSGEYLWRNANE